MSSFIRVQVVFELDADSGPWGDAEPVGHLREAALREAQDAAQRVVHAAAKEAHVRLRIVSIGDTVSLVTTKQDSK